MLGLNIDVQLKKHYDLIHNLVEVVKVYKEYEAFVLENVVKVRINTINQSNISEKAQSENILSQALKSLFALAENYPQLKASENFQKLQYQLSVIENDIQSARRYYNEVVIEFNNAVQVFPSNIIAKIFGFKQCKFFSTEESEREIVKVSF
jgi:LemA protein